MTSNRHPFDHNMEVLFKSLREHLKGDVRSDALSRKIYSVDASIYEVEPLGIVIPKDKNELLLTIQIAASYGVPIIARGAATGITGGCLGKGLVIDLSKYMNHILEMNIEQGYVVCEAGVVQDRLNEALSPYGFRLGPDTSTGNRATLGGMLANNAAGARSLFYGKMVDHVTEVELILADGMLIKFPLVSETEWQKKCESNGVEGRIYREILRIKQKYGHVIKERFPPIPRHVSGYNLDRLLDAPPLNVSWLIAGSEGTLGIAPQMTLQIAKKPRHTGLCIIHSENMLQTLSFVETMLSHHPMALEMIDDKILEAAQLSPIIRSKLKWLHGKPHAVIVAEFEGASPAEVERKLDEFGEHMKTLHAGYSFALLQNPQEIDSVWDVRKAGLGLLLSKRSYQRAIAFIEDISIPPNRLTPFLEEFCRYLKNSGKEAGIYGHVGSGCMHIRPYIDLRKDDEVHLMQQIMEDVAEMVLKYGGAMSGEHGDGLVRSWLNEKLFGKEIYEAFCQLKAAFDPKNLMNPGKVVNGSPLLQNLRLSPESQIERINTFLDFSAEGGIELAADLCNGNGQCRKAEGVMCPSFQVTGDEYHTTRARAQSLRAIIHGKLDLKEFTSNALYDVLDLCIECKGCKKECPSQVDMAKMKAEFLFQYQEKRGYSLRNRLFAYLPTLNRMSSQLAFLFNKCISTSIVKTLLSLAGITPHRRLPFLTSERFSQWFKKQPKTQNSKTVILFNDTFTEYHHPEIGQAAFKILTALGYEIILFSGYCCGRPLFSKGFLKQAKANALKVIDALDGLTDQTTPIICLEPSCASALRDDFKGLIGTNELQLFSKITRIASACQTLEEFLHDHLQEGRLPLSFVEQHRHVLVHNHCHQKALVGAKPTLDVLRSIPGFDVEEIHSGCCGMAGAFGYEKEHYDFSMQIGNLHLFPAIRNAPEATLIVASGFSCRHQILQEGKKSYHLAEAISLQMKMR